MSPFHSAADTPATRPTPPASAQGRRATPVALGLILTGLLAGCGGGGSSSPPTGPDPNEPPPRFTIPAVGTAATLDVGTWNLLFFGAPDGGPTNEAWQLSAIRDVFLGTAVDLWGVQEVVDVPAFQALMDSLPGYDGFLANDASVTNGGAYYSDFDDTELKVGLVYRESLVEVLSARVILTGLDFEFAGRPPLEVRVRIDDGAAPFEATVIVLHAKANDQLESFQRRRDAAAGLLNHVQTTWPADPVWVVGDFNDDLDESITLGQDTPYRGFLDAAPAWVFISKELTDAGETSFVGEDDMIDHILVSDEVAAWYVDTSAQVVRPDTIITNYRNTTTDHLPVVARFDTGG